MGIKLVDIEVYLPEKKLSNQDLEAQFPDWKASKIKKKVGITQRSISAENETALNMAVTACERLKKRRTLEHVRYLIFCTQSPDYKLPPNGCILQDRIGLSKNCAAIDISMGCSGFVYALSLAKGIAAAGIAEEILIVTSETYSKYIHPEDKGNRTIFGDAAAVTLVRRIDGDSVGEFELGTDGSGYDRLIVANGGARNPVTENSKTSEFDQNNWLHMEGPDIFNFTVSTIPDVVKKALQKNQSSVEDVDLVIFHQANQFILKHLRDLIGFDPEKFYINMEATGNTVSSTIPIALKNCFDAGTLFPGQKILLGGFGDGFSWGCVMVTITADL